MNPTQRLLICSLVLLPVANAHAKENKKNLFNLQISADYSSTDNALQSAELEPPLRETQTIYRMDVGGHYQNEWSRLVSNYNVQKETFQRDSEPDATEFGGVTQLTLGNDYQPLSLMVSHGRMLMLDSPDALDLAKNRDTQEIITVAPAVKTHFSAADSIMLMGTFTDVSYKEDKQKKSEQEGIQLAWIHGINKTDKFQFLAQQVNTSFEFAPKADYRLQIASAEYDVNLKRLIYAVQVGYNRAISKIGDDEFSSPIYKIESSYNTQLHRLSLSLSEAITDSSLGAGIPSLDDVDGGVAAKGVGIDLMNVRTARASWQTSVVCDRCDVSVTLHHSSQNYKELSEDGSELGGGVSFNYGFSRAASMTIALNHTERKFSTVGSRTGFERDDSSVSFNYIVMSALALKLYVHQERRTSVLDEQNHKENIIGLNLSYHF